MDYHLDCYARLLITVENVFFGPFMKQQVLVCTVHFNGDDDEGLRARRSSQKWKLLVNLPKFMYSISEYHPTMVTPSSPNRSLFIVSLQMK